LPADPAAAADHYRGLAARSLEAGVRLEVERKGRRLELDLGERLLDWELLVTGGEGCGDLEHGRPALRARLRQVDGAGLKPGELCAALFGQGRRPLSVLRLGGLAQDGGGWRELLPLPAEELA
jgi:hypothetical protein